MQSKSSIDNILSLYCRTIVSQNCSIWLVNDQTTTTLNSYCVCCIATARRSKLNKHVLYAIYTFG